MLTSFIAHRMDQAVASTPAMMRWLEHCQPEVMAAYRAARRSLFTWQLPLLVTVVAVALPIKVFRWLPLGHPAMFGLFLLAALVLAWPPPMLRCAAAAWRGARTEPRFSMRLRLMALLLWCCAALAGVGVLVLGAFFLALLLRPFG